MIIKPSKAILRGWQWGASSPIPPLRVLVTIVALLTMGILMVFAPVIIVRVLSASYTTQTLTTFLPGIISGILLLAIMLILRLNELIAVVALAIHLYVDWYLSLQVGALIMVLAVLMIFLLIRSPRYPWLEPRALWLWVIFLMLGLPPAIVGKHVTKFDIFYYHNLYLGALLFFWLGTVIARDSKSVRRFFNILAAFAALLAAHSILLATTGIFLLKSSYFDEYLSLVSNFAVTTGVNVYRLGTFFVDPNWNGSFFGMMLCIPLGLFFTSSSFSEKVIYLFEALMIVVALLFTFSGGACIAAIVGIVIFMALLKSIQNCIQLSVFIVVAVIVLFIGFSSQVSLLFQHLSDPSELALRTGAWQTAILVIRAFPLTGVGLGLQIYGERSLLYSIQAQATPLAHPHNSYLEYAAMAGLPELITFISLITLGLWQALQNRRIASGQTRVLLSSGIVAVITLSLNSWSINGWTLPPLAAIGWLVLGVIASPLLTARRRDTKQALNKNA